MKNKTKAKATSLLIAGVSALSLIPMTGAHAATIDRLNDQDGSITKAVAFADGKYMYEGYKGDADNALYYHNGTGSDKTLADIEDGELGAKYGKDSVVVTDGSDEYFVNLATGAVDDENTVSDNADDAERKLKTQLKKADRYDGFSIAKVTTGAAVNLAQITPDKFTDKVYYEYKETDGTNTLLGFTDDAGKYVDASYVANIYVYNGESTKKIKNFGKEDNGIKVDLKELTPIEQDKDNVYAIARVQVTGGFDLTGAALSGDQYYLQVISKDKDSDTEDGASLPKSVASYLISNKYNDDDMTKAFDKLINVAADGTVSLKDNVGVTVSGNSLVFATIESDEVVVSKFDLKNTKVEPASKSSKVTVYGVFFDDDVKTDIENGATSVSIDKDGNVWALNKGKIYRSQKGADFEKMFTCDGSYDSLSVYDENNLIAWSSDGDNFGTIGKAPKTDDTSIKGQTTGSTVLTKVGFNQVNGVTKYSKDGTTFVSNGWVLDAGKWYFFGADGSMKTGWIQDKGTWYLLGTDGVMKTGWQQVSGVWYYMNGSGAMQTGWLNDNGTWYYLYSSGAMAANTIVDGYQLGASGAWIQ